MTRTDESIVTRVVSRHGTKMLNGRAATARHSCSCTGRPPATVRWPPLLAYLEPHATVHARDCRGASGAGAASREATGVLRLPDFGATGMPPDSASATPETS